MRDTERETETQAKGEAGTRYGNGSRNSEGSRPELKADPQPLSHPVSLKLNFDCLSWVLLLHLSDVLNLVLIVL